MSFFNTFVGKPVLIQHDMLLRVKIRLALRKLISNDDGDFNENGIKAIGSDRQKKNNKTTLHVHHAFLYISFSFPELSPVLWNSTPPPPQKKKFAN